MIKKKKAKTIAKKKVKKAARKKTMKKKTVKRSKPAKKIQARAKREKVIAKVEHFFGKISVAAFKLKAPLSVGEFIHLKGHTTDFTQRVDSIEIEHQSVSKAQKGQDIGIKVKAKVRPGDTIFLAAKQAEASVQPAKPIEKPIAQQPDKANPYGNTKFLKF